MLATRSPRRHPVYRYPATAASTGSGCSINPAPGVRLGARHGADLATICLMQRLRALARKGHRHGRADAFGAADRQCAAVYLGQANRQRQTEPGAVMLACPGAGDLAE